MNIFYTFKDKYEECNQINLETLELLNQHEFNIGKNVLTHSYID